MNAGAATRAAKEYRKRGVCRSLFCSSIYRIYRNYSINLFDLLYHFHRIAAEMVIPAKRGELHEEEVDNSVTDLGGRCNAVDGNGCSRRRGCAEVEAVLVA
jgi:hypothetical protein